jgi:hypothetical protein
MVFFSMFMKFKTFAGQDNLIYFRFLYAKLILLVNYPFTPYLASGTNGPILSLNALQEHKLRNMLSCRLRFLIPNRSDVHINIAKIVVLELMRDLNAFK